MKEDLNTMLGLFDYLAQFISDNKKLKFDKIIQYRTKHITVVLEDIFQSHNASAVLRSCDCFGIQDIHIIENRNAYNLNPDVELGSAKWLNLKKYNQHKNNTIDTFNFLRKEGYRIVATSPHRNDQLLEDLKVDQKIALVFGTELEGLSEIAMENADEFVQIPMYGFTESFNISVSAAIILANLTYKMRKSKIKWQLNDFEKAEVLVSWARSVVKDHALLERNYLHKKS